MILSFILFVVLLVIAVYSVWQKHTDVIEKLQQATILTEQQVTDINVPQNKLDMSKQNAEMLAIFVKQGQMGQIQPITPFTVQAPNLPVATQQVADKINANDPTLPPQALEKSDNTIIVPNTNKTPASNFDVGVFKVNNYKNWEWSIGYGQHGGDRYLPVELQRNFSKDAAISAEYHVGGREKGFEVKYTRKIDKLFLLF